MRGHRIVGLACLGLLSSCANNSALDLAGTDDPAISTPQPDAGGSSGGSNTGGGNAGSSNGAGTNGGEPPAPADGGSNGDASIPPSDADDGGLVTPVASKLVFSEIMARPSGGSGNEWLELYNAGDTAISLSGCTLATGERGLGGTELTGSLTIAPQAYLLLGRDDVEAESGAKPDYVYDGVYLSPDETVSLSCAGQVVAKVVYEGAPSAASLQLDQRYVLLGKVDPAAFCAGTDALPLSDNLGTPKAGNHDCADVPPP